MVRIINIILSIGVFIALYFLYRTIQEPIEFNAADTGTFTVVLSNSFGCDSIVTIITTQTPAYNIDIFEKSCNEADTGTFVNTFTSINGCDSIVTTHIRLDLGTGIAISDSFNVGDDYILPDGSITTEAGVYVIVIELASGCDSTIYLTLYDNTEILINLPTGFTPNGDGVNDILYAYTENLNLAEFNMMVFDRLGEKLFESSSIDDGWDGTFRGMPMNSGVFMVSIIAVSDIGEEFVISQKVKLIR